MSDSPKLRRLLDLQDKLQKGKLTEAERKATTIADVDGQPVRMDSPNIAEVLRARIAAERGEG